MSDPTHNLLPESTRRRARWAPWLREVAHRASRFGALALVIGFAHTQEDAVERLVAADAARWVGHADPIVRGEAALVLAARGDVRFHDAILAVARDDAEPARLRGLLALGIHAAPGVALLLDEILEDHARRTEPAGICAAWALGALPYDRAPALVAHTLSSFEDGNWKRQGAVLLALLAGMARHPQHDQTRALQQLYRVRANRNPAIRAMLLRLLLPTDTTIEKDDVLELLDRGSVAERLAALDWLTDNATAFDADLVRPAERLATAGPTPELRAAALAVLTRLRHPPAIEIAARALRSDAAVEVEQGMHSALSIGGASMRLALERHLLDTTDPDLVAAMLRSWAAPPSAELADHCAALAGDRGQPLAVRVAAASTLSRSDSERAGPVMCDLFRAATSPADLELLGLAIVRRSKPMPRLSLLLPDPPDVTQHPLHWRALLAASHPGAIRRLLEVLGSSTTEPAELRVALGAWRQAMVTGRCADRAADLPDPLRELLVEPVR